MKISDLVIMTVTYGNRFDELSSGPLKLAKLLGCKIVIVCNGISEEYRQKLEEYIEVKRPDVKLIVKEKNLGSSGGFSAGIEYCSKLPLSWLLILDDDNFVSVNGIKSINESKLRPANFLHRKGRKYMDVVIEGDDPKPFLSQDGAFLGLSLSQQVMKKFSSVRKGNFEDFCFPWSPYGGLLLSDKAVTSGILPNKDYFLYCDDTEYTNKLSKKFGLYLLHDCKVDDLSASWNVAENKNLFDRLVHEKDNWRVYYSVRNQSHFDFLRKNKTSLFVLNILLFFMILFLYSVFYLVKKKEIHYISRFKLIVNSAWQGLKGRLGNKGINW